MFQAIINFFKRLFSKKVTASHTMPTPEASEPSTPTPIGNDGSEVSANGNIRVGKIRAINDEERQMVVGAFIIVRDVIGSKFFEEETLKFKFDPDLVRGLTNQQILDLYRNTIMTANIEMFYGSFMENKVWKTNAYEANEEGFIRINRYFINNSVDVGSTILHELGHAPLGFTHPNLEQNSVSYGMNRIYTIVTNKLGLSN